MAKLSKFLANKKFLTGDHPKYADFHGYEYVIILKNMFPESFKEWNNLD